MNYHIGQTDHGKFAQDIVARKTILRAAELATTHRMPP